MNHPIICAGFHRSGTSLASQMIHLSGVPFALEAMPGNISNPDGHFEDIMAMHMHDEFLSESGSNWQFHEECEISHEASVAQRIKSYSDCRYQIDGSIWLMKDPRATLYLDDWKSALNGDGKFVLLYRHWGLCIQSLLKRHSKNMAYDLPTGKALSEHITFWKKPELAARMWLTYNKAMIKFIKANKENCLLVSQASLIQGCDLITTINHKFDCQLEPISSSPVKAEYASESINSAILDSLPTQLQSELENTYQELSQLCDTDNNGDIPEFVRKDTDERKIALIIETTNSATPASSHKEIEEKDPTLEFLSREYQKLTFDELLVEFKKLKPLANKKIATIALQFSLRLAELEPYKLFGHEWTGRIYTTLGQHKDAGIHFIKAISIGNSPPYIKMLLGDSYFAEHKIDLAEYYYLLALKGNPDNPVFYNKLGYLYLIKKSYRKAINHYENSLSITDNEWTKIKLINIDELCNGTTNAIIRSENYLKYSQSEIIRNRLISLKLESGIASSRHEYKRLIKETITRNNFIIFLSEIKFYKFNDIKLKQLIYWLSLSWDDLYNGNELENLLVPQQDLSPINPKLTIIVISYNMDRELPRTVASLLPSYQQDITEKDIEIIIIDNGSKRTPIQSDFNKNNNIRIIKNPTKSVSPVSAINLGLSLAKSDLIGVLIDGARMASPGLFKHILKANRLSDRAVISTLGFHLGPEVQMSSVRQGYNQSIEDQLLKVIDWQNNGYDLFSISSLAGSSANGYFQPIAESNAIFMPKHLWQELEGYDECFKTPGGGYANLDVYYRACQLKNTDLIVLMSEGTFHQVHGGVATNLRREDATPKIFQDEYISIRKKSFSRPDKKAMYIGSHIPQAQSFLKFSVEKAENKSIDTNRNAINSILLGKSYCKPFETNTSISEKIIDSPIIITGRGGSGTRLLSKLMQGIDIFLGNEINETEDSIEWVGPIYDLVVNRRSLKNGSFNERHINRLRENAKNILTIKELNSGLWGFKLPETMLCIPELLKAFPNAKIIHLVRHPVSISMRRSHMTSRFNNSIGKTVLHDAYTHFGFDVDSISEKEEYFNNAISWAYQLQLLTNFVSDSSPKQHFLHVKYEEIITNPARVLNSILDYLNMDNQNIPELNIDLNRVNHKLFPPKETEKVWSLCQKQAIAFGYTKEVSDSK